jgi:hypothetical protein
MVVRNRKKGRSKRERECLPTAPVLLVCPNSDFGTSRFKGNYIIRDLTRLRNRWYFTPANWHSKSACG